MTALLKRIVLGASGGIAIALLALLVGVGRAIIALALGIHFTPLSRSDVEMVAYYVSGFTLGGVFLSAVWPLLRNKALRYVGFAVAGQFVGLAIGAADAHGFAQMDGENWGIGIFVGLLVGLAVGHGFLKDQRVAP